MIREDIKNALRKAIKDADYKIPANLIIETAKNLKFGDYASSAALIIAKDNKHNPQEIAKKISKKFQLSGVEAEVAGGFVNFKLNNDYLFQELNKVITRGEKFFQLDLGNDLRVNIEFISANPTGPLHLGNGRGGFCGDVLARVFESFGAKVDREYYVNDRGLQIEKLGHSILKDKEAVYQGGYIDDLSKKLKAKSQKLTAKEVGEWGANEILQHLIKKTIKKMGIKFDKFFLENSLYQSFQIEKYLGLLQQKGQIEEKDGALWFRSTEFADDKDRVIKRANDQFTYFASDIAYHANKIERGYDLCINFWGADHAGYAPRLYAAVNSVLKEDFNWQGELKIVLFQLVKLVKDGKEARMSKRAGNVVTLDELLAEVGVDVARFFFLMHSYNNHMTFDLDLAKKQSKENPVYYVQYAHARIASILAKTQNSKSKYQIKFKAQISNFKLLNTPEELNLIKEIIRLPEIIEDIVGDYQVHKLPYYAIKLADSFHRFYENCRVIDEKNSEITSARLALCQATQITLAKTLDLMGISAPKKM